MNKALDHAAENHTSVKVKSNPPTQGRLTYTRIEGVLNINITNSSVSYTKEEMKTFGEMIQVLQEEGQLNESGSIPIANLYKM